MIGTGGRCVSYARAFGKSEKIEIVAVADPDPRNRQTMFHLSGVPGENIKQYDDWHEMLEKHPDIDGATVITPNYLHREPAIALLERGVAVALEKPMTTTMHDSEQILEAVKKNSRIVIGFVLRSTPFYLKIRELLQSGAIGTVLSVQADELGSYGVSSIISRSPWRRYKRLSGGSLMEKSSHDIDLLNWLLNSRPVSVNSYGGKLLFRPNPMLPEQCADCKMAKECPYFNEPEFSEGAGDVVLQKFVSESNSRCIYNIDKDTADNQSVSIQYQNGAIANFMMCFNCSGPRSGRNFHAIGTRGRIYGNLEDRELHLYDNLQKKDFKIEIPVVEGGHNGGDVRHAMELLKMMEDPSYRPEQDAYAGYLSNAVCIAADLSIQEKRQIAFRYDADDFITFH